MVHAILDLAALEPFTRGPLDRGAVLVQIAQRLRFGLKVRLEMADLPDRADRQCEGQRPPLVPRGVFGNPNALRIVSGQAWSPRQEHRIRHKLSSRSRQKSAKCRSATARGNLWGCARLALRLVRRGSESLRFRLLRLLGEPQRTKPLHVLANGSISLIKLDHGFGAVFHRDAPTSGARKTLRRRFSFLGNHPGPSSRHATSLRHAKSPLNPWIERAARPFQYIREMALLAQASARFSALTLPRILSALISKVTFWPSASPESPARSTALMCTNTSVPPSCGWMKPKPFWPLNHLTVPCGIYFSKANRRVTATRFHSTERCRCLWEIAHGHIQKGTAANRIAATYTFSEKTQAAHPNVSEHTNPAWANRIVRAARRRAGFVPSSARFAVATSDSTFRQVHKTCWRYRPQLRILIGPLVTARPPMAERHARAPALLLG